MHVTIARTLIQKLLKRFRAKCVQVFLTIYLQRKDVVKGKDFYIKRLLLRFGNLRIAKSLCRLELLMLTISFIPRISVSNFTKIISTLIFDNFRKVEKSVLEVEIVLPVLCFFSKIINNKYKVNFNHSYQTKGDTCKINLDFHTSTFKNGSDISFDGKF